MDSLTPRMLMSVRKPRRMNVKGNLKPMSSRGRNEKIASLHEATEIAMVRM